MKIKSEIDLYEGGDQKTKFKSITDIMSYLSGLIKDKNYDKVNEDIKEFSCFNSNGGKDKELDTEHIISLGIK